MHLGRLELAVRLRELAVGLLELRRPLAHALLEAGVQLDQRLVGLRVLQCDGRLLGKCAEELGVAGGVEEPRALGAGCEQTHQVAAQQHRHGDLCPEPRKRRARRLLGGWIGVAFGRIEGG